jgi:hypothetical protein
MQLLKKFPFYVFLLALYPVVSLLSQNINEVEVWVAVRPALVCLALGGVFWGVFWLFFRNSSRAALVASLVLVLFFSYGPVYHSLKEASLFGFVVGRQRVLILIYLAVLAFGIWFLGWKLKDTIAFGQMLNIAALAAIILPIISIGRFEFTLISSAKNVNAQKAGILQPPQPARDIYYFILDTYTRADVLKDEFGYDNQPFISDLKRLGFTVQNCARSNYASTELSLSTSLNFNYLEDLGDEFKSGDLQSADISSLPELMRHSQVRSELEALGYKTVAFETGYYWSSIYDADFYFEPTSQKTLLREIRPFEQLLINNSLWLFVSDVFNLGYPKDINKNNHPYAEHINRQLFILDKIKDVPQISGPKFVFVHILIPHYPLVFQPDGKLIEDVRYFMQNGQAINQEYFDKGYVSQVQFINNQMIPILESILKQSNTPPIIIVQGDHGPKGHTMLPILNAYYLPDLQQSPLYKQITPVNSFRAIFNTYFDAKLPYLADISRFSTVEDRYHFSPFEETSPECR